MHLVDPFVRENVACGYDVVTLWRSKVFDSDAILYGDTRCKKMDISIF